MTKGSGLPIRLVIYGPECVGKTSLAAQAPGVIVAQTRGETGLDTLLDSHQLTDVAHFPGQFDSWENLVSAVEWLSESDHSYNSFVLDALDGAEMLCREHVRKTHFHNDEHEFIDWGKGFNVTATTFREFLTAVDNLRAARKMRIVFIAHSVVRTFNNPEGPDYDRYIPNLNDRVWQLVNNWADVVLFYNFYVKASKDGKASGDGSLRYLYATKTASFDAKNRIGLLPEINAGKSGAEAWANLVTAVKAAYVSNGKEKS